ncbi:MAG: YhdH/YhfP family quinone oxidoreductase [Thermodesulfobacteriota bacterium]
MNSEKKFQALLVRKLGDEYVRAVEERALADLPAGEVLVRVRYSSLNYKDGLSATGNRGVTRRYPHTPGIDAVGEVVETTDPQVKVGREVIVHCYDLGMNSAGGFGQYIRVPAGWLVPLPEGLSPRQAMMYGTGGFTAAMSVHRLLTLGLKPEDGPVLVTGATGGVGSLTVAILAREGFEVVAASGKAAEDFLLGLGAARVIGREQVRGGASRAILRPRWAGVVDCVGGEILTWAVKSTKPGGIVTTCGNVAGADLDLTVYPFILRGVTLTGIDAAECPLSLRQEIWARIARDWRFDHLSEQSLEVGLAGLSEQIDLILAGKVQGRVIVRL